MTPTHQLHNDHTTPPPQAKEVVDVVSHVLCSSHRLPLTQNGQIYFRHPTSQQRHIETCFSRRRNLTAARHEYKHILVGA